MSTNAATLQASDAGPVHNFVLPNEQTEYSQIRKSLMSELNPQGILEQTFADEIVGATWRLRRCRLDEGALAKLISQTGVLPESVVERKLKSIEGARAAANLALRRCTAELRKLQTERAARSRLEITDCPLLADTLQVLRARHTAVRDSTRARADHRSSFCKTAAADPLLTPEEFSATRRETLESPELVRARNRAA